MYFLIGIIILIIFIISLIVVLKIKLESFFNKFGFPIESLGDIIKEARLEDQDIPKSLSGVESLYLPEIKKDFNDISIDELKKMAEEVILDCYLAFNNKDASKLKGKIKKFVLGMIEDNKNHNISFKDLKIHKTVISDYKKRDGEISIYFSTSYQYDLCVDDKFKKVQDRVKTEFLYVYDKDKVPTTFSIHCPNCGSPITSLGEKKCSYCGSLVKEIYSKTFKCVDIIRY